MFEKIKQDLLTIHGIVTTLIHMFLIVGGVTCWIAFQTQVLGKDPLAPKQDSSDEKPNKPTGRTSGK
jgi:hypothetical protein